MSGNTQIGRLLATRFAPFDGTPHSEGRVVFWHDEVGEFSEEVDSIVGPEAENEALRDVELVRLERNPFALKYRIMLAEPTTKFLVYVEGNCRPMKTIGCWILKSPMVLGSLRTSCR